ncbi:DMT family transporter [Rhodobacteraceae bacterium]|nr:DMT family transporter [Paracoccaceae bacterium]
MPRQTLLLFCVLGAMGAGWGLTQPLSKIAVSEGYRHAGLIFWQMAIGAIILGVVQLIRRKRLRLDRSAVAIYLLIAFVGTLIPNTATYEAIRHLPSGLISIFLALVPMFAFPIALVLGNETFEIKRFLGLILGLFGVLLIIGPEASLPDRALIVFVPLALVAPFFYGFESNAVAKWGTAGLDPVEVLFGASLTGAILSLPVAIATGEFINPMPPWHGPDFAILGSGLIHVVVYCTYVWMVGRAGAVFAAQVSYLVTGFGVLWAMLILGERFSGWVWAAMGVMMIGMFLVQPRIRAKDLEGALETGQS